MKRKYRFIDIGIPVIMICFFCFLGFLTMTRSVVKLSDNSNHVTVYSAAPDPDSAFLEQLPGDLPHSTYKHLVDSFRSAQKKWEFQNEGLQQGWSMDGILGFTKIKYCDTCTRLINWWDNDKMVKYVPHYYITFGTYEFKPGNRSASEYKYPIYYRKVGRDSLKYLDIGEPVVAKNGSTHYNKISVKKKALPFRYNSQKQRLMIVVSATTYTVVVIARVVIALGWLITILYMISCFIKLCIDIARGNFFIEENRSRLNFIAYSMILFSLCSMLAPYLLRLLFASYITDDIVMVHTPFTGMSWGWLLAGVFFLLLAKAFDRGMKLQQEQELTV